MFPPEVFTIVKTYLSITDISALALTCSEVNEWVDMNSIIREYYLGLPIVLDGNPLFHVACDNGYINLVMYLCSIGVDPRANNDYAIRRTSYSGHLEVVKYLFLDRLRREGGRRLCYKMGKQLRPSRGCEVPFLDWVQSKSRE